MSDNEKCQFERIHALLHDSHSAIWKLRARIQFAIFEIKANDNEKAVESLTKSFEITNNLADYICAFRDLLVPNNNTKEYASHGDSGNELG